MRKWKMATKDLNEAIEYQSGMFKLAELFDMYFESEIIIGEKQVIVDCLITTNETDRQDNQESSREE